MSEHTASVRAAIALLPFGFIAPPVSPALPPAAADAPVGEIEHVITKLLDEQQVPGAAVAVVDRGAVLVARGYGLANLEYSLEVAPETLFQSGSVGKMFTAAAVLLLVEDGQVALSDPIAGFFPEGPTPWARVTVQHLLNHTSGLLDDEEALLDYRQDYSEDELVGLIAGTELRFEPGEQHSYSNAGYILLGVLIHRITGQFYGDFLEARVFKPLGMRTTRVISESEIVPNRAAGYELVDGELRNQQWVAPMLNTTADGSLYLSLLDLLAWDRAVRSRTLLSDESWTLAHTPAHLSTGDMADYGLGWEISERGDCPLYFHTGGWQGFKSHYAWYPCRDLSVIVLLNGAHANSTRFRDAVAAVVDPALARPADR